MHANLVLASGVEGEFHQRKAIAPLEPLPVVWSSVKHWLFLLALNEHVVQDDTASHDLSHLSFRPGLSGVPNNSESRLEHTKCPLDILPANLLKLRKPGVLASWHRV